MRRIGVLMHLPENDPEAQARVRALLEGLQQLGWTDGRNVRIDYRFGAADVDRSRRYAAELIALAPDVIQASGTGPVAALQQASRTVPIVFVQIPDPVNAGFVDSLSRPGGNATGFTVWEEFGTSGKWLELLKEVAPHVTRVAVLRDPTMPAEIGQTGAIQSVAPSLGVQVSPVACATRRDRARHCGIRARGKWRADRVRCRVGHHATRTDQQHSQPDTIARGLPTPRVRCSRRSHLLWVEFDRSVPARGSLRRSHPQGREAGRSAGAESDQVSSWSSTSRPRRRSASKCRRRCSPAPTR